jgi:hypothetical protein
MLIVSMVKLPVALWNGAGHSETGGIYGSSNAHSVAFLPFQAAPDRRAANRVELSRIRDREITAKVARHHQSR